MQTAEVIKTELKKVFTVKQATVLSKIIVEAHDDLVKADDFNELKDIVKELAEAQKRTEERVEELAEAQKELAGAQKELAEAQKRTEEEIRELVMEHRDTRKQLGGLSDVVGYGLEDKAYSKLPELLKRDFGIIVSGKISRRHVKDKQWNYIEVNIIGEAVRDGKKIMIVGEAKSQLSKNKVDEFIEKKLNRLKGVYDEIFPVLITYMVSEHDVEDYAKKKKIAVYYSYDLQ